MWITKQRTVNKSLQLYQELFIYDTNYVQNPNLVSGTDFLIPAPSRQR